MEQRQWWKPTRYFWLFSTIVAHYYQKRWQQRWEDMLLGQNEAKSKHSKVFDAQREFLGRAKASGIDMAAVKSPPEGVKAPTPGADYVIGADSAGKVDMVGQFKRRSRQEEGRLRQEGPPILKDSPPPPTSSE
jgi:hypothetical protein